MKNKIEISSSKTKLVMLLLVTLFFICGGLLIFNNAESFQSHLAGRRNSIFYMKSISCACVVFSIACAIVLFRKLIDKKIGLTIDELGIIDNSSAVSAGRIMWQDIVKVSEWQYSQRGRSSVGTKFVLVFVKHPQNYLDRQPLMKRQLMATNSKLCGTPISITTNSLKISHGELYELLKQKLAEYQRS